MNAQMIAGLCAAVGVAGAGSGSAGEEGFPALAEKPRMLFQEEGSPSDLPISADTRFYFRIAGWYTVFDTQVRYGDSVGGAPTRIDLEDTLDMDPDLFTLCGSFGFRIGERLHLDFGINGPFHYDADSKPVNFSFGDFGYAGVVESELDMITFDADVAWDAVHADRFRLWLGGGIRAVGLSLEIEGQATDRNGNPVGRRTDDLDAFAAIPVVGAGVRWDVSRNVYLAARGMGLYAGDSRNALDLSAEIGWDFVRNVGVFAGFRYTHFEADYEIDDLDFELTSDLFGPYAGVEVRF